jgi:Zn-dependent protease
MLPSWNIGKAFGIPLYVHWTFALLPAWVALVSPRGGYELLLNLGVLAAAFGCVLLHELGHALAARRFGIATRDITLYPIGGVARLERMAERPAHELVIALAGPAVNLVIAVLLLPIALAVAAVDPGLLVGSLAGLFLLRLLAVNVVMVVFNLLPAFPMDGGRVLRALLTMWLGELRATQIAVGIGAALAAVLGVGGTLWLGNPWLMIVAAFIFLAGQAELQGVYFRERQRRLAAADVPTGPPPGYFSIRPRVTVYLWDSETGRWVQQPDGRSDRVM